MIEATCSACGTLNRVPKANVPAGAKFVACSSCKSRVAIAPAPAIPSALPSLPPAIPKPPPIPARTGNVVDLADLPAPKRASALPPVPPAARPPNPGKPPMRSGLAAALDPELPAPRVARPARPSPAPSLELDDPMVPLASPPIDDSIDLPAPKKPAARAAHEALRDDIADLPAPKASRDIADLPAPKASRDIADLPAPKRDAKREVADLPAPKHAPRSRGIPEIPAPSPGARTGPRIPDVAMPRTAELPPVAAELPAPESMFDDVPRPALHKGARDAELPAPEGLFDDLPQPALHEDATDTQDAHEVHAVHDGRGADLPAPKGFFDDLPQPALDRGPDLPAPKGFFDDLPQPARHRGPDLPAPKGFFDDLPQVKSNPRGGEADVPAPKGFFEDIPGLPHTSKPELPAPKGFFDNIPGLPHTSKPGAVAPTSLFDDLPGPGATTSDEVPRGFFDDLPQPAAAPLPPPPSAPGIRPPPVHAGEPMELGDGDLHHDGPELELISPTSASAAGFEDLDLSPPAPASGSPIRFEQRPRKGAIEPAPSREASALLELEGPPPSAPIAKPAPRPARPAPVVEDPAVARARTRRRPIALAGVLAVAVLGGAGFMLYRRHAAAQQRAEVIAEQLDRARASYSAADPQHWQSAAAAARKVIELDDKNAEALGIAAEALFASALADGIDAPARIGQARALIDAANSAGLSGPQLARARALAALVAHQPEEAIGQLRQLAGGAPGDATLSLYLGIALGDKGDRSGAIAALDRATTSPAVKIAALYFRGQTKLSLADFDGARADFAAILELARDHIGAQVGLAAAQPPAAALQQEADLLAILARKDIATADPRAVVQAWTLAGHAAMRAGRSDVARERYRKALAILPDLDAISGLAETELRDGNVTAAAELTAKVLSLAKDNIGAQLVESEIEIKQNKLALAAQRLAALANHATPLAPLELARLHLTSGKLLEAQGNDAEAVEAYARGARVARDLDLAPLMAAIGKLATMTAAAVAAKDQPRADQLRARADQLLGELAGQAEHDPRLALTLGVAYLQQDDAAKAESWLRRAAEARPRDAEARFQLGRALLKAGHQDAAIDALDAAHALDGSRADIAGELARAYEVLGRDSEAGVLYGQLLAGKDPSLELRARAGRFFVRTGAIDKAVEQGGKILEVDARNPAGLYLKGEGLLAAGRAVDARQSFQRALEIDRDPRYLDALGRAAEALAQGGDREQQDLALRSYMAAAEAAPAMFNPLAGQGRLYVARHEAAKAVTPLLAAAALQPKNAEVMFLIGAAYQELQQAATALQWLEAAMKISATAETAWRIAQLYRDANQGARSAAAVATATRLASESEKRTGKPIAWLTDAWYLQGRVNLDLHNDAGARDAWIMYVARNPPASAQLTEVKQLLATQLRR